MFESWACGRKTAILGLKNESCVLPLWTKEKDKRKGQAGNEDAEVSRQQGKRGKDAYKELEHWV